MKTKDFDRFMEEREDVKMDIVIFGRHCKVPMELPWDYVLKVERMFRTGESISGQENIDMLKRLLSEEDFEYVTTHPDFRASYFWEIIAYGWLRDDQKDKKSAAPSFRTEDDIKVERSRDRQKKTG